MNRFAARGGWVPLLLAGVVAAFFWKIVFLGRAIGGLDVLEYFFPYRTYARQAVDSWRLPLWNPDHFGGAPFLANIQNSLFYPPTALFYVLDFPTAYTWSVVLHSFLGALFAYLFARQSLRTERIPALIGALAFAFGGFLGGQMGHLNQLSAAVWLPALLLCWDKAVSGRRLGYVLLAALAVAMQFLAGHSQETYYMLVTLGLYAVYTTLVSARRQGWAVIPLNALAFVVIGGLGAALAATQLVPTSELTSWSIRANGLAYGEATAFSLKATMLLNALLPPFGNRAMLLEPGGSEYLGYAGITAILLALAGLCYARRRHTWFFAFLAAMALFFTLGLQNPLYPLLFRIIPGFNLFRVPARWLFLYGFSTAMLAALGANAILAEGRKQNWRPLAAVAIVLAAIGAGMARLENLPPIPTRLGWSGFGAAAVAVAFLAIYLSGRGSGAKVQRWRTGAGVALVALLGGELFLASQSLDYNDPTIASIFDRPIPTIQFLQQQPAGYRAVSVARDEFVPSVEPQVRQELGSILSQEDLLTYLSYYKLREILEPNTSMAVNLPTIDGYDGGLLPLARYVRFKNLLTGKPSAPDDRIRFVLKSLPNRALLDAAGVRYVVMDALSDKTVDGVRYDLSSYVQLGGKQTDSTLTLAEPQNATSVGVVLAFKSVGPIPGDAELGHLTLSDDQGNTETVSLPQSGAPVGQLPSDDKLPTQLVTLPLDTPMAVRSVTFSLAAANDDLYVNGLALIDSRAGSAYSPLVAPGPEMKAIYRGDVKIYENTAAEPPAFLVHSAQVADDPDQAATALDSVDPAQTAVLEADPQPPPSRSLLGRVITRIRRFLPAQSQTFTIPAAWLEGEPASPDAAPEKLTFDDYRPEHMIIRTDSSRAGFLVISQAIYPGWQATVDGAPARIMAADVLFQAVHVPAGQHRVELTFQSRSLEAGEAISLAAVAVLAVGGVLVLLGWRRRGSA
ncbi:MAG TPA: YfhO family protein [Chloroflexota bacterium]|nr:YfhO family protein [Chloroflexota bacterium]